jgi:type I restriction enzyme S subunit
MNFRPWLGYRSPRKQLIPAGWTSVRLGTLLKGVKAGGRSGRTLENLGVIGVPAFSAEGQVGFFPESEFHGPAVILSSIGERCGKCFYSDEGFFTLANTQVLEVNTEEIDSVYLFNLLNDERFWPRNQTAQPYIKPSDAKKCWIAVPPHPQDAVIGSLIRHIDQLIAAARTEHEKGRRLKNALLQQLFTKGLPSRHKSFKKTKIGEIPEEWDVRTIRSVLSEPPFSGVSPESRSEPPGTPILNVSCVKSDRCDPGALTYVDVDEATIEECQARKGDFFVLRGNGNREYVATGGLLEIEPPKDCIFSDKLIRLRFNAELVAEGFIPLMWQSYSFLRRLQSKAESGSGLWMMSKRDIRKELFTYPKKDEQEEIVATLRRAQDMIDSCDSKVIALERLKRSLLQNLLTGRIRLGEFATGSNGSSIWEPRISN